MNLFQHFMGRQPYGLQAHTGGGMQPMPQMQANTGGGLPAMAQGFPSVQTGGGLPAMPQVPNAGGYDHSGINPQMGGNLQPQQAHGPYWQGDWRQQLQGEDGLAGMFRGFSPYFQNQRR